MKVMVPVNRDLIAGLVVSLRLWVSNNVTDDAMESHMEQVLSGLEMLLKLSDTDNNSLSSARSIPMELLTMDLAKQEGWCAVLAFAMTRDEFSARLLSERFMGSVGAEVPRWKCMEAGFKVR